MATLTAKKKKLKDEIYLIIRKDNLLKEKIAKSLQIENESVTRDCYRFSPKLSLPHVLDIISKHTGKPKEELLDV